MALPVRRVWALVLPASVALVLPTSVAWQKQESLTGAVLSLREPLGARGLGIDSREDLCTGTLVRGNFREKQCRGLDVYTEVDPKLGRPNSFVYWASPRLMGISDLGQTPINSSPPALISPVLPLLTPAHSALPGFPHRPAHSLPALS